MEAHRRPRQLARRRSRRRQRRRRRRRPGAGGAAAGGAREAARVAPPRTTTRPPSSRRTRARRRTPGCRAPPPSRPRSRSRRRPAACDGDGAPNAYLAAILAQPAEDIRADAAAQLEAYAAADPTGASLSPDAAPLLRLLAGADGGGGGGGGEVEGWPFGGWLRGFGKRLAYAPDAQAIAPLPSPAAEEDEQACWDPLLHTVRLASAAGTEQKAVPSLERNKDFPLARCTTPAAAPPPPPYPRSPDSPSATAPLRFRDLSTLAWHLREILTSAHPPPPARSDVLDASFVAQLDALAAGAHSSMWPALRRPRRRGGVARRAARAARRPTSRPGRPPVPPRAPPAPSPPPGRRRRPRRRRRRRRLVAAPARRGAPHRRGREVASERNRGATLRRQRGRRRRRRPPRPRDARPLPVPSLAELRHLVGAHARPRRCLSSCASSRPPRSCSGATARLLDELVALRRRGAAPPATPPRRATPAGATR